MELFSSLFTVLSISFSQNPWILMLCYVIHECGHVFFSFMTGAKLKNFHSGLFRLCIGYDCVGVSYLSEALVYGGGIIFNLISAFIGYILFSVFENGEIPFFILCNLSLAIMNIYPISVLDGGGALKCVFLNFFDEEKCEKTCRVISFVSSFVMWLCAVYLQLVFSSDISFFFISVFLLVKLCFSA